MPLKIIAAVSENGVIGNGNDIPWKLRDDLRWFKEQTMGYPLVMGRKTFDSIVCRTGKPLPGRENIVLTNHPGHLPCDGVTVLDDWEKILERSEKETLFVVGGAEIYKLALPRATELLLTRVHAEIEGDISFPNWDPSEWESQLDSVHTSGPDEHNEHSFTHEISRRVRNQFIEMTNCRTDAQRAEMQTILERGHCPFCPENLKTYHDNPILFTGVHWLVSKNDYPYPGSGVHLIFVLKTHATSISELPSGALEDLQTCARWAENKFSISGGLFMRFGNPLETGATIRHLHTHMATTVDRKEPVKFYLG